MQSVHQCDGQRQPKPNGNTYEYTSRCFGCVVAAGSTNNLLDGCQSQRNLAGNDSVQIGPYSTLSNWLASDGQKHNVFLDEGCTLINVEAHKMYFGGNNATMFILFGTPSGAKAGINFINCWAHCDTYQGNVLGFYTHSGGPYSWGNITATNCEFDNLGTGFLMGIADNVSIVAPSTGCATAIEVTELISASGVTAITTHSHFQHRHPPSTARRQCDGGGDEQHIHQHKLQLRLVTANSQNVNLTLPGCTV